MNTMEVADDLDHTVKHLHLLSMPREILDLIVGQCKNSDLAALRLSCRLLCSSANEPFADAYLFYLRFVVTEYSLKHLVHLTESVFCPHLQFITFGTCRLAKSDPEANRYEFEDDVERQQHEDRRAEQTEFINSGRALKLLVQAFQNLKKHGKPSEVVLGIHDDPNGIHVDAYDEKTYGTLESYGRSYPRDAKAIHTFSLLRYASTLSDFPFKKLSLNLLEYLQPITKLMESDIGDFLRQLLRRSATEPDIDVFLKYEGGGNGDQSAFHLRDSGKKLFLHALSFGHEVDSESLYWDVTDFGSLPQDSRGIPFEKLTIWDSTISVFGLRELVSGARKSLRTLELKKMVIKKSRDDVSDEEDTSQGSFLRFVRDDLSLDCLTLDEIEFQDADDVQDHWQFSRRVIWKGSKDIYNGIEGLLEDVKVFEAYDPTDYY